MIWICLCSVWFLMTQFGSELKAQMEYELYPYSNIGISANENNKVLNASQSYRLYAPDSGVYCPYTVLPRHPPDRLHFSGKRIMIFPNPATQNDAIHIQFSGVLPDVDTSLKVIDMHGRRLWQDVFMQNELIIPANLFPVDGMYFLEASLYNTLVMKKF